MRAMGWDGGVWWPEMEAAGEHDITALGAWDGGGVLERVVHSVFNERNDINDLIFLVKGVDE